MREPSPVQHPLSKSSGQSQTPQSETLAATELLAPRLPHPPSYASALVPPAVQEPISATAPLVSVSQETPAPSTSTSTVEAVPSATHTASESELAPVPSVQEHVVISTPADSVLSAPPAQPLPITSSPLTLTETEPVVMPLPAEPAPVVLSPSAKVVDMDISPTPLSISDPVMSPPPSEAPTVPLTDEVLTAPPFKTIPLPTSVAPIDIPVESAARSTPLKLEKSLPGKQVELLTTPTSVTEMSLSPDTPLIESVETLTNKPPAPDKPNDLPNNLEELMPPTPTSALFVPCEVLSVGQIKCPPNEDPPAPVPIVEPAVAPVLPPLTETVRLLPSPQSMGKSVYYFNDVFSSCFKGTCS